MKKHQRILLRLMALILIGIGVYYTIFIETKKYESNSVISVKDLSKNQSISALGAMFLPNGPGPAQDSKVLDIFINSEDMYDILDKDYNLTKYYTSKQIDFLQRLYPNSNIPFLQATKENLLNSYRKDLQVLYEPTSATISIAYMHSNPKIAQAIVKEIIKQSKKTINKFEQENAKVVLQFLEKQEKKYKQSFISAIKKLIKYQNRNGTFDPKIDIEAKSTLLATLESELIKNQIEYESKLVKLQKNSPQMKALYDTIQNLRAKIINIKKEIAGKSKNRLNTKVYDFEFLKSEAGFAKEMYKQILLKVEETKLSVNKSTKNLIVITNPTLPQSYTKPKEIKQIVTIFIVVLLFYSIIRLMIFIIRDHVD